MAKSDYKKTEKVVNQHIEVRNKQKELKKAEKYFLKLVREGVTSEDEKVLKKWQDKELLKIFMDTDNLEIKSFLAAPETKVSDRIIGTAKKGTQRENIKAEIEILQEKNTIDIQPKKTFMKMIKEKAKRMAKKEVGFSEIEDLIISIRDTQSNRSKRELLEVLDEFSPEVMLDFYRKSNLKIKSFLADGKVKIGEETININIEEKILSATKKDSVKNFIKEEMQSIRELNLSTQNSEKDMSEIKKEVQKKQNRKVHLIGLHNDNLEELKFKKKENVVKEENKKEIPRGLE